MKNHMKLNIKIITKKVNNPQANLYIIKNVYIQKEKHK